MGQGVFGMPARKKDNIGNPRVKSRCHTGKSDASSGEGAEIQSKELLVSLLFFSVVPWLFHGWPTFVFPGPPEQRDEIYLTEHVEVRDSEALEAV